MAVRSWIIFLLLLQLSVSEGLGSTLLSPAIEAPKSLPTSQIQDTGQASLHLQMRFEELRRIAGLEYFYNPQQKQNPFGFRMVAVEASFSKAILLRTDVQIPAKYNWQIYRHESGFFLQLPISSKPVSVFFLQFQEKEVIWILTEFRKQYAAHKIFSRTFVSEAYANSELAKSQSQLKASSSSSQGAQGRLGYALSALDQCSVFAQQGAISTLSSPVTDAKQAAVLAVKDWDRFWNNTLKQWQSFKEAVFHFEAYAKEKYENFISLPRDRKEQLFCEFLGGGLVSGGAAFKALKSASSTSKLGTSSIASPLAREITEAQRLAIEKAHLVGHGEVGADGTVARVGNYTFRQKYQKSKILKEAGFTAEERRKLFKDKIVGDSEFLDDLIRFEDDIRKLEKDSWKYSGMSDFQDKIQKLRDDLEAAMDAKPSSMPGRIAELSQRISEFNKKPTTKPTARTPNDIFMNPASIRKGEAIQLGDEGNSALSLKFTERAFDDLMGAEKVIVKKMVESIRHSVHDNQVDSTKIKMLSSFPSGSKGRVFEVRIINRGHQRLFGCFKDGVFSVLAYDPQAPQEGQGTMARYKNLCQ